MTELYVFLFLFLFIFIDNVYVQDEVKILSLNETDTRYHKKYVNKSAVCEHRRVLCKKDKIKICAMRFNNETIEYKLFDNTCYLFMNNLCEYLGHEFHIVEIGFCKDSSSKRIINRRMQSNTTTTFNKPMSNVNATSRVNVTSHNGTTDNEIIDIGTTVGNVAKDNHTVTLLYKPLLRHKQKTTMKRKFEVEEAFDDHPCPNSCPDLYSPVCMSVNRGEGKYFKYFTFYNHCFADQYYCIHYKDLGPAPSREYEDVQVSPLGWSFCGAYRYLQFARYSEVLSSMGHYGWLAGDHRYSHIMEPHQRIPGFG